MVTQTDRSLAAVPFYLPGCWDHLTLCLIGSHNTQSIYDGRLQLRGHLRAPSTARQHAKGHFSMRITPGAAVTGLFRNLSSTHYGSPIGPYNKLFKHLSPPMTSAMSGHQLDCVGQASGWPVPQPVSTERPSPPLSSFQSWQPFVSPSVLVKTTLPGMKYNILHQKLNTSYQELCPVSWCKVL